MISLYIINAWLFSQDQKNFFSCPRDKKQISAYKVLIRDEKQNGHYTNNSAYFDKGVFLLPYALKLRKEYKEISNKDTTRLKALRLKVGQTGWVRLFRVAAKTAVCANGEKRQIRSCITHRVFCCRNVVFLHSS